MIGSIELWESILRLLLAAALGGLIGWEREYRGKPAGLRTNMMVALGAATFTLTSMGVMEGAMGADPTRIVTGVATGIGFLGAGSILKSDGSVRGMTTAAGIWVVGAVGSACGIGAYSVAVAATLASLVILTVVGKAENHPGWRGGD